MTSRPSRPRPDDAASGDPLGCTLRPGGATFRIFAPRATSVVLEIFDRFEDPSGSRLAMAKRGDGIWERTVRRKVDGKWYGYRIDGPAGPGEMFDPSVLVSDPYSTAVTTVNHWRMPAKTLVGGGSYDWGDDRRPPIADQAELVIYECHVRDMSAHPSSGARRPGTYAGLSEEGIAGGLAHIRELGANAVELLPVMKFGTHEIPFMDPVARTDSGRVNDWNPYERNHWGYMTSHFFAPETYYAAGGTADPGAVNGRDGRAAGELKDLVRAFHRNGIAVILDVVYNHTSHYDFNPFKYADKKYYYRCDDGGAFLEASGCGNDFFTEQPMARRAVVDSVAYWLTEYRVDGFRFDLAGMLDEETCRRVTAAARSIHQGVVLIAEPWGGGRHHPAWFRELGWWSWNDRFRDGVKGRDPVRDRGLLFGSAWAAGDPREVLAGELPANDLPRGPGGALNYVESHDGYTLGDFIRIATGEGRDARPGATLTPRQLALNRFAALVLLTAPGPVMLHEGQEFARSKAIVGRGHGDPEAGRLDHNSYNKDDATNHLDFSAREANRDLFDYYRGLVRLRRLHPALCRPRDPSGIESLRDDGLLIRSSQGASGRSNRYIVLLNASADRTEDVDLPAGPWTVLADAASVHPEGSRRTVSGTVGIAPTSGMVLMRRE